MTARYFEEADEDLLTLAEEVMDTHHKLLKRARIGFAFLSEAPTRKGRKVLAQVSLVPDAVEFHLQLDYLLWVARDEWDAMNGMERRAVLDHEFCHCDLKENGDWGLRDHDVQEFIEIIHRHGLWNNGLVELGHVVQGVLPLEEMSAGSEGRIVAAPILAFAEVV